jgi:hypothetical protein
MKLSYSKPMSAPVLMLATIVCLIMGLFTLVVMLPMCVFPSIRAEHVKIRHTMIGLVSNGVKLSRNLFRFN